VSFPAGPWSDGAPDPSPLLVELKTWGGEFDGALAIDLRARARAQISRAAAGFATFGPHSAPDQLRWASKQHVPLPPPGLPARRFP
jgi:hypothetical protein